MKRKMTFVWALFAILLFVAGCASTPVLRDGKPIPGALEEAASEGRYSAVRQLLDAGASPEETNKDGYTALMGASFWGYNRVVLLLIERGADVNKTVPYYGFTALMISAGEGRTDTVELLLEKGASIDQESLGGFTALTEALKNNERSTARLLLEKGASSAKAAASLRRNASWDKTSVIGLELLENLSRGK